MRHEDAGRIVLFQLFSASSVQAPPRENLGSLSLVQHPHVPLKVVCGLFLRTAHATAELLRYGVEAGRVLVAVKLTGRPGQFAICYIKFRDPIERIEVGPGLNAVDSADSS